MLEAKENLGMFITFYTERRPPIEGPSSEAQYGLLWESGFDTKAVYPVTFTCNSKNSVQKTGDISRLLWGLTQEGNGYAMILTTIGIPVYNEIQFIQKTLDSVDGQADEIIICDNASTDGTSDICADFAATRSYVRYIPSEKNKGGPKNFSRCLAFAKSKYFMWVGGHDLIEANHVKHLQEALEVPGAVLAYANAIHVKPDYSFSYEYSYDFSDYLASDQPEVRLYAACAYLTDCTIFHGLYKKEILERAMHRVYPKKCILMDHVVLSDVAVMGKMVLQKNTRYIRVDPDRDSSDIMKQWLRVIRAYQNLPKDPTLVPKSIYQGSMRLIDELEKSMPVRNRFIELSREAIQDRWGAYFQQRNQKRHR